MGQKINPIGFRLALNKNWASRWYANNKNFSTMLLEDIKVRDHLKTKLAHAAVSRVVIERPAKNARITVHSARPGVVIGKKGEEVERIKGELQHLTGKEIYINIREIKRPANVVFSALVPNEKGLERAMALAEYLHELNGSRDSLERSVYLAANKQVQERCDLESDAAIVLAGRGWHPGVIGIVAGRLAEVPELQAKILFEELLSRHPERYHAGQVRTFQRRVALWRAQHGPPREVFFPQEHRP